MKILLLGDTHGDYGAIHYARKMAFIEQCTAIIQLGDFGYYWRGNDTTHGWSDNNKYPRYEVMWLPGNHEDWPQIEKLIPDNEHMSVTYLGRTNLLNLKGLKVLTVGGAYSVDQGGRTEGIDYFPQEEISTADVHRAIELATKYGPIDVMLSHDAPSTNTLMLHLQTMAFRWGSTNGKLPNKLEEGSCRQRMAIEAIVDHVKPRLLVHGHYHYRYEDNYMNTHVVGLNCNGTGRQSIYVLDTEDF